jgi:hypothetical protein
MNTFCRTVVVVAFLFIIFGCSSKGELQVQRGLDTRIDHRAVASLSVEPDERVEKTEAVLEAVRRLRGQLFGRLVSEGVFGRVVQEGEAAQYDVRARLLTAAQVSQTARILLGVLAGRNELAVQVDVFDTGSRASLSSFTAKGESASHPLSSENDMDDAIRKAVDQIIVELKK